MLAVQPHRFQRAPLALARGREHLQPQLPGELHRRDPHATGRSVHQHPLALLRLRQIDQA